MSRETEVRRNLASYLTRTGWTQGRPGVRGELWTWTATEAEDRSQLAVPFELTSDSDEFATLVNRLAAAEHRKRADVHDAIENEFFDVQSYRISDQFVIDDSALLGGANDVLDSAFRLTRAAATTARSVNARIGGNFSKRGDELAAKARLSHTKHGSFVLPVVMPVEASAPASNQLQAVHVESAERQVTRTLASALSVLQDVVVRSAKTAGPDEVAHLVQSGVSQEVVKAVRTVALSPAVKQFDASFSWSPAAGKPERVPDRIVIPDEAAEPLNHVWRELGKMKVEPDASVAGPIVLISFVEGNPFGEIAIRTERRSRIADVHVRVSAAVIHESYVWARLHQRVVAHGQIERAPGQPLRILNPRSVGSLELRSPDDKS